MKNQLLLLLSLLPIALFGQATLGEALLFNARVQMSTNGLMFNDFGNGQPGYEVPYGTGINAIFASSLWLGGLDSESNLYTSAMTHCQEMQNGFCEFYPGPLKADGSAPNSEVQTQFNRIWYISRTAVELQKAYFECSDDPDCDLQENFPMGYGVPSEIVNWPGNGDTEAGYPAHLAPFIDYNGDGYYNPMYGDYPSFTGDAALYTISNDMGGPHLASQGEPLGVEIHSLFYYYNDQDPALSATLFVHQDIINRSSQSYKDMYLGVWNDFDLGNPFDDYIGTDVENGYVYVYNGDDFDEPSSSGPGYGSDLAMMACKILAGPYLDPDGMDNFGPLGDSQEYGDYTKGWGDGIVDNERMGLSSSIHTDNSSTPTGKPTNAPAFYNNLRNIWSNEVPVTFGGTGYNPENLDALAAKYVYPGTSDPLFAGTGGVDPQYQSAGGWTEGNELHEPSDRQIAAVSGPFSLDAGQIQSIDYMYVFARQSGDPEVNLHDLLTQYVSTAAAHPDSLPIGVGQGVISSVEQITPKKIGFGLYPNPARETVTIAFLGKTRAIYRIFNVLGIEVSNGILDASETKVDISALEHGLYIVNMIVGDRTATQKLVVK